MSGVGIGKEAVVSALDSFVESVGGTKIEERAVGTEVAIRAAVVLADESESSVDVAVVVYGDETRFAMRRWRSRDVAAVALEWRIASRASRRGILLTLEKMYGACCEIEDGLSEAFGIVRQSIRGASRAALSNVISFRQTMRIRAVVDDELRPSFVLTCSRDQDSDDPRCRAYASAAEAARAALEINDELIADGQLAAGGRLAESDDEFAPHTLSVALEEFVESLGVELPMPVYPVVTENRARADVDFHLGDYRIAIGLKTAGKTETINAELLITRRGGMPEGPIRAAHLCVSRSIGGRSMRGILVTLEKMYETCFDGLKQMEAALELLTGAITEGPRSEVFISFSAIKVYGWFVGGITHFVEADGRAVYSVWSHEEGSKDDARCRPYATALEAARAVIEMDREIGEMLKNREAERARDRSAARLDEAADGDAAWKSFAESVLLGAIDEIGATQTAEVNVASADATVDCSSPYGGMPLVLMIERFRTSQQHGGSVTLMVFLGEELGERKIAMDEHPRQGARAMGIIHEQLVAGHLQLEGARKFLAEIFTGFSVRNDFKVVVEKPEGYLFSIYLRSMHDYKYTIVPLPDWLEDEFLTMDIKDKLYDTAMDAAREMAALAQKYPSMRNDLRDPRGPTPRRLREARDEYKPNHALKEILEGHMEEIGAEFDSWSPGKVRSDSPGSAFAMYRIGKYRYNARILSSDGLRRLTMRCSSADQPSWPSRISFTMDEGSAQSRAVRALNTLSERAQDVMVTMEDVERAFLDRGYRIDHYDDNGIVIKLTGFISCMIRFDFPAESARPRMRASASSYYDEPPRPGWEPGPESDQSKRSVLKLETDSVPELLAAFPWRGRDSVIAEATQNKFVEAREAMFAAVKQFIDDIDPEVIDSLTQSSTRAIARYTVGGRECWVLVQLFEGEDSGDGEKDIDFIAIAMNGPDGARADLRAFPSAPAILRALHMADEQINPGRKPEPKPAAEEEIQEAKNQAMDRPGRNELFAALDEFAAEIGVVPRTPATYGENAFSIYATLHYRRPKQEAKLRASIMFDKHKPEMKCFVMRTDRSSVDGQEHEISISSLTSRNPSAIVRVLSSLDDRIDAIADETDRMHEWVAQTFGDGADLDRDGATISLFVLIGNKVITIIISNNAGVSEGQKVDNRPSEGWRVVAWERSDVDARSSSVGFKDVPFDQVMPIVEDLAASRPVDGYHIEPLPGQLTESVKSRMEIATRKFDQAIGTFEGLGCDCQMGRYVDYGTEIMCKGKMDGHDVILKCDKTSMRFIIPSANNCVLKFDKTMSIPVARQIMGWFARAEEIDALHLELASRYGDRVWSGGSAYRRGIVVSMSANGRTVAVMFGAIPSALLQSRFQPPVPDDRPFRAVVLVNDIADWATIKTRHVPATILEFATVDELRMFVLAECSSIESQSIAEQALCEMAARKPPSQGEIIDADLANFEAAGYGMEEISYLETKNPACIHYTVDGIKFVRWPSDKKSISQGDWFIDTTKPTTIVARHIRLVMEREGMRRELIKRLHAKVGEQHAVSYQDHNHWVRVERGSASRIYAYSMAPSGVYSSFSDKNPNAEYAYVIMETYMDETKVITTCMTVDEAEQAVLEALKIGGNGMGQLTEAWVRDAAGGRSLIEGKDLELPLYETWQMLGSGGIIAIKEGSKIVSCLRRDPEGLMEVRGGKTWFVGGIAELEATLLRAANDPYMSAAIIAEAPLLPSPHTQTCDVAVSRFFSGGSGDAMIEELLAWKATLNPVAKKSAMAFKVAFGMAMAGLPSTKEAVGSLAYEVFVTAHLEQKEKDSKSNIMKYMKRFWDIISGIDQDKALIAQMSLEAAGRSRAFWKVFNSVCAAAYVSETAQDMKSRMIGDTCTAQDRTDVPLNEARVTMKDRAMNAIAYLETVDGIDFADEDPVGAFSSDKEKWMSIKNSVNGTYEGEIGFRISIEGRAAVARITTASYDGTTSYLIGDNPKAFASHFVSRLKMCKDSLELVKLFASKVDTKLITKVHSGNTSAKFVLNAPHPYRAVVEVSSLLKFDSEESKSEKKKLFAPNVRVSIMIAYEAWTTYTQTFRMVTTEMIGKVASALNSDLDELNECINSKNARGDHRPYPGPENLKAATQEMRDARQARAAARRAPPAAT